MPKRQPPVGPIEQLLTIAQTAELLQVDPKTIRRYITARTLAAHKLGRQWRIAPGDVDELLARTRHGR